MPFPALTIARLISFDDIFNPIPENILKFNQTQNYEYDVRGEIGVQGQLLFVSKSIFEYKSTSDFVDILKAISAYSQIPFDIYRATWGENQKLDFAEVLTTKLLGRAFNLIEESRLLNLDV